VADLPDSTAKRWDNARFRQNHYISVTGQVVRDPRASRSASKTNQEREIWGFLPGDLHLIALGSLCFPLISDLAWFLVWKLSLECEFPACGFGIHPGSFSLIADDPVYRFLFEALPTNLVGDLPFSLPDTTYQAG